MKNLLVTILFAASFCAGVAQTASDRITLKDAGDYSPSEKYSAGDVVLFGGTQYKALASANTGHTPGPTSSYWRPLGGGVPNTVYTSSYLTIELAVGACGGSFPCQIVLNSSISQSTSGTYSIPSGVSITGQAKGLIVPGVSKTLNFANAPFTAPPVAFFTGAGTITGMAAVKPEWFGDKNASGTMAKAIAAISSSGGVIEFQATTYRSDFDLTPYARANIWWKGVPGQNLPAAGTNTALTGGTIIQGRFSASSESTSGWHMSDIGFDAGTSVCSALYGGNFSGSGHCPDAFYSTTSSNTVWNRGSSFENLWFLGSSSGNPQHAAAFEGFDGGHWKNIHTVGNIYGVVVKGPRNQLEGVYAYGHNSTGFYAKSDLEHSRTYDLNVSNLNVGDWGNVAGYGLLIDGTNDVIYRLNFSGYNFTGSGYALMSGLNSGSLVSNVNLSNFNFSCPPGGGVGIVLQNAVDSFQISNGTISGCSEWADTQGATTNIRLSNVNMQSVYGANLRGTMYLDQTHIENPLGYTTINGTLYVSGFTQHSSTGLGYVNLNPVGGGSVVGGFTGAATSGGCVLTISGGIITGTNGC